MSGPKSDYVEPCRELRRILEQAKRFRELHARLKATQNETGSLEQKALNLVMNIQMSGSELSGWSADFKRDPEGTLKNLERTCLRLEQNNIYLRKEIQEREEELTKGHAEALRYRHRVQAGMQSLNRLPLPAGKKSDFHKTVKDFIINHSLPVAPSYPENPDSIRRLHQTMEILKEIQKDLDCFQKDVEEMVQVEKRSLVFENEAFKLAEVDNLLETLKIHVSRYQDTERRNEILKIIQEGLDVKDLAQKNNAQLAAKNALEALKKREADKAVFQKKVNNILSRLDELAPRSKPDEMKRKILEGCPVMDDAGLNQLEKTVNEELVKASSRVLSELKQNAVRQSMEEMGYLLTEQPERHDKNNVMVMVFDKSDDREFGVKIIHQKDGHHIQFQVVRRSTSISKNCAQDEIKREKEFCIEYKQISNILKEKGFHLNQKTHLAPGKMKMVQQNPATALVFRQNASQVIQKPKYFKKFGEDASKEFSSLGNNSNN